jgi:hypothetical protein
MNSLNTFEMRIRDELAAVEKEIQSHNQQVGLLTKRLEGLKRADELFDSDQAALAELLQASLGDGSDILRQFAASPATAGQRAASRKRRGAQKQLGRGAKTSRGNMNGARANVAHRTVRQTSGLTRVDMMAAVLKRHPRRTVRELIALLDKQFHWKANESAVTGKLYTRRDLFVHTQPDRTANRPVTWSLK